MDGVLGWGHASPAAGMIGGVKGVRSWLRRHTGGQAAPRRPVAATSATVLVADDDHAVRLLIAETLRQSGYRVLEAADGEEALAIAARHREIRLLITDLVMPRMGGGELAGRFAAARPGVPVLFVSGSLDDEGVRERIGQSDAAFLAKPFALQSLLENVRAALPSADNAGR